MTHYIKWYWGELLLKIHEFRTRKDRVTIVYQGWIMKEQAEDNGIEWDILRKDNYYVHVKE